MVQRAGQGGVPTVYSYHPPKTYVTSWADRDPRCRRRMLTMLSAMGVAEESVVRISEDDIPRVMRENDWTDFDVRQGRYESPVTPSLLFSAFRWPTAEQRARLMREPLFQQCQGWYTRGFLLMVYGYADFFHYEDREQKARGGAMCFNLYDLHSLNGCLHGCNYCRRGRLIAMMLNVEEFVEQVDRLLEENPWQKVIRYDVESDILPFEPEYGASKLLVDHFARLKDRYIILFSKSANVDFLMDLDHRGHTIIMWTLSPHTVSTQIEKATASMRERIEAARRCQEAGYHVRFKFKPVIPIRNWRAEYREMLELLFSSVRPNNLSMDLLFTHELDTKELFAIAPPELLDPEYIRNIEEAKHRPWLDTVTHMPFSHEARAEMYDFIISEARRICPGASVSLCAETQRMWDLFGRRLGSTPRNFACNCGPQSVPGLRRLSAKYQSLENKS